uniref:Uncharacterized protein n=1 Tax=Rhizophora mucronata TaxID=61149 RepID=A0A2P2QLY9_RHIMU
MKLVLCCYWSLIVMVNLKKQQKFSFLSNPSMFHLLKPMHSHSNLTLIATFSWIPSLCDWWSVPWTHAQRMYDMEESSESNWLSFELWHIQIN